MTDTERRLDDIEKRVARLERAAEREPVRVSVTTPWCSMCQQPRSAPCGLNGCEVLRYSRPNLNQVGHQFCQCGRDICRAPDCPSHKPDPLGR